jgi:hypothetical protein
LRLAAETRKLLFLRQWDLPREVEAGKLRSSTRGHRVVGDKLCFHRTNLRVCWLLLIQRDMKIQRDPRVFMHKALLMMVSTKTLLESC